MLPPPLRLSTAPGLPDTHWYQIRLVLREPLVMQPGSVLTGGLPGEGPWGAGASGGLGCPPSRHSQAPAQQPSPSAQRMSYERARDASGSEGAWKAC
jgi:hypothetical protein